jgi:hypothetical protein
MPATTPRQFRLTADDLARLDDLCRFWGGPVKPLDRSESIREAIRRAHQAEARNRGHLSRTTKGTTP